MDRFRIRSFFAQFPFLSNIATGSWYGSPDEWCSNHGCTETGYHSHPTFIREDDVEEVKVNRISPEFLHIRAWYRGATGSLVGIDDSERVFLLDKDGRVLVEVEQSRDVIHNEPYVDDEYEERETVGEALLRLKSPDDVMYAVSIHTGYEIRNHQSVGGNAVILYKSPKGFTLKDWVEEQERRAKAQVEAMVAEIDAEA